MEKVFFLSFLPGEISEKWHRWDESMMYVVPVERNNLILFGSLIVSNVIEGKRKKGGWEGKPLRN